MSSRPSRGAARLAAILDALPDALLLVNCNGTVVNANTIALETFESPGTALVGRGLLDLLPSFDSKRIPGSMRRPDNDSEGGRTKPTRMVARRTDGTEFPVELTSANLEDGRTPYESAFEAAYADHHNSYTGNELLMLVVRDLTGTLDTEAELGRQQRQTEMILRAAAEGVVGVDNDGRVVLVNPSAAQILGYRASDLGGKKLHPLVHHSRADGTPLPYDETPLSDTLHSGRKHRVRGQVLWAKDGRPVPVDVTTAPVRDGDQLVGAVLTFTDRRPYDSLAARHAQLLAVLQESLRGPLEQLRGELGVLASDPAGQLWPEANQILHHLAAGYSRMTTLVDNVISYQRLDAGADRLRRRTVSLDAVVAAGVEGAIELIGPGRAQFAVHAPAIEAEVDAERLSTALAHLIADVAGVDSTGNSRAGGVSGDSTIVVAAAQRGEVVRIEVRGPYAGGDPVHEPIVRGIVQRHGGVLQTHDVPGGGGSAYVLEVPLSAAGGSVAARSSGDADGGQDSESAMTVMPTPSAPARGTPSAPEAPGMPHASANAPGAGSGSGSGTDSGLGSGSGRGVGSGLVPAQGGPAQNTAGRRRARQDAASPGAHGDTGATDTEPRTTGRPPGSAAPARRPMPALPPAGSASGHGGPSAGASAAGSGTGAGAETASGGSGEGFAPGGTAAPDVKPTGRRRGRPSPTEVDPVAQGGRSDTDTAGQPGGTGRRARHGGSAPAVNGSGPDRPHGPAQTYAPAAPAPRAAAAHSTAAISVPATASPPPVAWPGTEDSTDVRTGGGTSSRTAHGPYAPEPPHADAVPQQGAGRRARRLPATGDEPGSGIARRDDSGGSSGGNGKQQPPGAGDGWEWSAAPGLSSPVPGAARDTAAGPGSGLAVPERGGPAQGAPDAAGARPGDGRTAPGRNGYEGPDRPNGSQGGHENGGWPASGLTAVPGPARGRGETGRGPDGPGLRAAGAFPQQSANASAGRRARRALAPADRPIPGQEQTGQAAAGQAPAGQAAGRQRFALPPAEADRRRATPADEASATAQAEPGPTGLGPLPSPNARTAHPQPYGQENAGAQPYEQGGHGQFAQEPGQEHTPPQAHPLPTGRRRGRSAGTEEPGAVTSHGGPMSALPPGNAGTDSAPATGADGHAAPADWSTGGRGASPTVSGAAMDRTAAAPSAAGSGQAWGGASTAPYGRPQGPEAGGVPDPRSGSGGPALPARTPSAQPPPPVRSQPQQAGQPALPAAEAHDPESTQGRSISVRTLGQGVPFAQQIAEQHQQPHRPPTTQQSHPHAAPPAPPHAPPRTEPPAPPHADHQDIPQPGRPATQPAQPSGRRRRLAAPAEGERGARAALGESPARHELPMAGQPPHQHARLLDTQGDGRAYAIGAPDEGAAEGPEPLDGPNGAVDVTDSQATPPLDDELPPEPLDNPRRLLVWPAPDVSTQQALSDRGYRPVIVHSREEVDAQIAAYPAALFVDPLTGPITRTALQSLRTAAVAAEVPVLVTAGLGQATRDAAYGADPAVLLKALAPRDSDQHPPRVLLIEEDEAIAGALAATLERRGMQVAHAASDADAVTPAAQMRPNLVVMDLMQVRRRRAGIIDWLRANGMLNRTPLVVYTSAGIDRTQLSRLSSGETVLFLAERSTTAEVQGRIVDLLAKVGTN